MTDKVKKCAHPLCSCMAAPGSNYCSNVCADSKGMTSLACDCKHPGCSAKL
ncbi:hypothetical protein [Granulicella sp. WH15]|uniref:hypothetical protein n=1 Tax=Granulicella sp. WH15 TaxID=2602070 RepID=UPI0013A57A9E|nr:hypothetical protein [Granulicella sp. WH15]